jgi:ubiquinone/menaquinone biosynthesis C-methylase UbiE
MSEPKDRLQHPRFARAYVRLSESADKAGVAAFRSRMLAGLSGRIIEVGAGNGRNFPYYPDTVTSVLAVEPDRTMLEHARNAAAHAQISVTIAEGHADALPADDASMDAAVTSLVLCTVPDQAHALAEIMRVLRPGGELRFYEHVRSNRYGLIQDLISPVWAMMSGGCRPNRDTAKTIEEAGFEMVELDRFGYSPARFEPPTAHILGTARKPVCITSAS